MEGDRIVGVGPSVSVPPGAKVIHAEGQTVMPGLFDLHTHLPYSAVNGINGDWPKNLAAYLLCGITSVVDFGTYPETFDPMRRLIESGQVQAPHLSIAARFTTPGGHGGEAGRGDFFSLEVLTPREARAAVRRVIPYKPDLIKVSPMAGVTALHLR
jgi:imidazolonepropionase-like amidohydrolase